MLLYFRKALFGDQRVVPADHWVAGKYREIEK